MGRRRQMERDARSTIRGITVAAALLAFAIGCAPDSAPVTRPHVVLVSIDTLRADHLAAAGYARDTCPVLTRVAAEGARFRNAYAQASSTIPSHASLFTGLHPFAHGAYHMGFPLTEDQVVMAERFADAGYVTAAATSSVRFDRRSGFAQGFSSYREFAELPKNERSRAVTDHALDVLANATVEHFLFLHYFGPHEPYAPPEPYRTRWHPGLANPRPEDTSLFLRAHREPEQIVDPPTLDYLRALYDGEIAYLCVELERLFATLHTSRTRRPTLLVVTSDHGEEFKEHGGLSHARQLHEELLRVPLLFWWPDAIAAGQDFPLPVQGVDVLPTLLELAGLPDLPDLHGLSLAPLLRGRSSESVRAQLQSRPTVAQRRADDWSLSATLGERRYKYTRRPDGGARLHDLSQDPIGSENLLDARPEVARQLDEIAQELGLDEPVDTGAPLEAPESLRERLRAIGYVDEARELE